MQKSHLASSKSVKLDDKWPMLTEQDMDAAQQLIQLSGDSSLSHNSADLLDDHSTAVKLTEVKQDAKARHGDDNNSSNNNNSQTGSTGDHDVLSSSKNIKKRKFRTVEELYRATSSITVLDKLHKRNCK